MRVESESAMRECWRLAMLLVGSRAGARRVLARLTRVVRYLDALDPVRLDRLVVLTSREIAQDMDPAQRTAMGSGDDGVDRAARALAGLGGQAREAWVLGEVLGRDEVAMSRAMDCSRTAARRYLNQGLEMMGGAIDRSDIAALCEAARSLEPSAEDLVMIRRENRAIDRAVQLRRWLLVLGGVGLVLIALVLAGR